MTTTPVTKWCRLLTLSHRKDNSSAASSKLIDIAAVSEQNITELYGVGGQLQCEYGGGHQQGGPVQQRVHHLEEPLYVANQLHLGLLVGQQLIDQLNTSQCRLMAETSSRMNTKVQHITQMLKHSTENTVKEV